MGSKMPPRVTVSSSATFTSTRSPLGRTYTMHRPIENSRVRPEGRAAGSCPCMRAQLAELSSRIGTLAKPSGMATASARTRTAVLRCCAPLNARRPLSAADCIVMVTTLTSGNEPGERWDSTLQSRALEFSCVGRKPSGGLEVDNIRKAIGCRASQVTPAAV